MAYENFNDSARTTASDKILRDIAFDIAKNPKCDGYQRGLVQSFIISLIKKKTSNRGIEMENMSDQQLAEELIKSIIRKLKKRKVKSPLIIDNIWVNIKQICNK